MRKHDLITGLIWIGLGIAVAVSSYRLRIGELRNPGPGLMPFLIGISLSLCSLPVIIGALRGKHGQRSVWSGVAFKRLALVAASLLIYALILEKVGFALSTLFLLLLLFKAIGSRKWPFSVMASILTVVVAYFVFVVLLKVELPPGLWEPR